MFGILFCRWASIFSSTYELTHLPALGAVKRLMASYMTGWPTCGAGQQSQQSLPQSSETQRAAEPLHGEDDGGAVPVAACIAEPGRDSGGDGNSSDSCSEADMPMDGVGR